MQTIYQNRLGSAYLPMHQEDVLSIQIRHISFLMNVSELKKYIRSTKKILKHFKDCKCHRDFPNKEIAYQTDRVEVKFRMSLNELKQLLDLFNGTKFTLDMEFILSQNKIKNN